MPAVYIHPTKSGTMPQRVYIETTFISYLIARPSRDLIVAGHQQVTHDWWDHGRGDYELCISQLVVQEAGQGDPPETEGSAGGYL